jgi:hypothetical protein
MTVRPLMLGASLLLCSLPLGPAPTGAAAGNEPGAAPPAKAGPTEASLQKALEEQARKTYRLNYKLIFEAGDGKLVPEDAYRWSRRWLEAALDRAGNREGRVAAYRDHLGRMRDLEQKTQTLWRAGQLRAVEAEAAVFFRTEAELWLTRAQAR